MNSWSNIKTIAKRELGSYFASPIGFVFIIIFLIKAAFFPLMLNRLIEAGQASLQPFFFWHPWIYLIFVPAVGMRLWSEEYRLGTLELLLTMPVTTWQAITGKFLASWAFIGLALALTCPLWLTLNYLGSPDNGTILCGYIGSLLLAGAYLAIASMTSAMTRNQVVSFILAVVICFFMILCGFPAVTDLMVRWASPGLVDFVSSFSFWTHFQNAQRGVLDSRDVLFFLSVIGFSLFTTGVIIRSQRAG